MLRCLGMIFTYIKFVSILNSIDSCEVFRLANPLLVAMRGLCSNYANLYAMMCNDVK